MGSFFGGSAPSSQSVYQPTGTAAFDQSYQNLVNSTMGTGNPYGAQAGTANALFGAELNNNFKQSVTQGANLGGQALAATGAQASAASPLISNAGTGQLLPAVQQTLNTAFDPQSQLYQRTLQQLTDQSNVQGAQSGTTNSPYGASVADATKSNFNIDWQAQQLANQIAGIGAAGTGINAAGQAATTGANLGATGAQDVATGAAMPYAASNAVTNDESGALQQLMGIVGNQGQGAWDTNTLNALMSYLGLGTQQGNIQAGINQQAQQNAQSGIGGLLGLGTSLINGSGGLGSLFGSSGGDSIFGDAGGVAGDALFG